MGEVNIDKQIEKRRKSEPLFGGTKRDALTGDIVGAPLLGLDREWQARPPGDPTGDQLVHPRGYLDSRKVFWREADGTIVLCIGRDKGAPAATQPGFLGWLLVQQDFPDDTKDIALKILAGETP